MRKVRRRKLIVDSDVQRTLLFRVVCYSVLCLLAAVQLLICLMVSRDLPPVYAKFMVPLTLFMIVLLPLVFFDFLRLTHRLAGPMVRLRNSIKSLADGQTIEPVKLRDGDYWNEVVDDLNRLIQRVHGLESKQGPDTISMTKRSEAS